ncbi:hypothetical protein EEL32_16455 [Brevibacillus laterosporus]|uniref:Uncharacterized protein n=1 Tax=Brevibacillus laterosporus TaxID=1465 RepID=A0A502H6P1_BRELA|nr:hypothetical protein EEL30_05955 [Brevibacillus laterosporus]TPG70307.1 hypothetical protein EEL31_18635 [Brevibacillus laterosporus]TPG84355.1 hypothetical protein EEL32_16455 [Brevibacillus laterosporus]
MATWCNFSSSYKKESSLAFLPIIQHVRPFFHSNKFFLPKRLQKKKEHLMIIAFSPYLGGKTLIVSLLFVTGWSPIPFSFFLV